ncbi:hypothetical protein [Chelativorans sp. M5D2P16]|uniref:hypothetical protein n=1 Tax=Chelativorans sp. M5D2P16 TaxID=3095678 RepID=UPI002ACA37EE|nr:hypothetical protein [Chelativorans sp. M5D2P16]MDZ5699029.1 hypothetical protein [Chelativorans sp. M5D2P16]
MWNWISQQNEPLNVVLNSLMLVVWVLYFQLLLNGYRRARHAKILINRANGHSLGTQCVVTNMSTEAIYIEGVIAELKSDGPDDTIVCSITDWGGRVEPEGQSEVDGYQGPLNSGRSVELGPYHKIIEHSLGQTGRDIASVRALTLTIVATYGSEDRPVAAQRDYEIVERMGQRILRSESVTTHQVRSKAERRRIERQMRDQVGACVAAGDESPMKTAAE